MTFSSPAPSIFLRTWLVALSLGLISSATAQLLNPLDKPEEETEEEGLPAMKMLIEGSILQGVIMPQYDESRRLSSVMRAAKLTMVNEDLIHAEILRIEFFDPDRSPKGRIDLATASVEDQQILRSTDPVSLVSDELNLEGTGLVYELKKSRGFLHGPARATTLIDTRTSMKSTSKQRSVIAGAMIAAATSAPAEGLEKLDDEQLRGLDHLAASKKTEAEAAVKETEASIEASTEESNKVDETLGKFLREAAIDVPTGAIPDLKTKVPDPEPFAGKQLATISADDGIYFDSEAGLLVLLGNVKATHPEFTLEGADEVKIFLEKQPKDEGGKKGAEQIDDKKAGELLGGSKFGDPSKLIATGTLKIEKIKTKPGDKGAKASGREIVFDFKTNEAILRGGEPWIISDSVSGRVVEPNGYIRMNTKTGDGETFGKTVLIGEVKDRKK